MIIITVEGGFVQEVYNDNPGELVLVRDFDNSDENGNKPAHEFEFTFDLKACDPAVWPDVDMDELRKQEQEHMPDVELIASGYDWQCPACNHWNNEPEIIEKVNCTQCNGVYTVSGYSHPDNEAIL